MTRAAAGGALRRGVRPATVTADDPDHGALPAPAEEPVAAVGLEPGHADPRRQLEPLQHRAAPRVDAPHVGLLALRGEGSIVSYSAGRREFAAAVGFVAQVVLEEEARNRIATGSIGPQLTVPVGPARPYAAGTIGLAHFSTATTIRVPAYETSTGRAETLDTRTNFSHTGKTVGGVGGVLVPLAVLGLDFGSAMLDVGVRYQRNPHARFVRPGDVRLNATTSPEIRASEGEANVLSYRVGVAARFD